MTLLFGIFIIAAVLLIGVGIYSLVLTRNLIRILLSIEILIKAATLLLIGAGHMCGNMSAAQSFVITLIIIEVMILVVATGIVYSAYINSGSLNSDKQKNLKG